MSSSSFAPLAEAVGKTFRSFGASAAETVAAAPEHPPCVDRAGEQRQATEEGAAHELAAARAELEAASRSFAGCLRELAEFRVRLQARCEREIIERAFDVARQVVQRELSERPDAWLGMIRAAVERSVDREYIALRVTPSLMAFLRAVRAQLGASLPEVKELELIEDPSLPAGGCVIESRLGDLDLGVETRLARSQRALVRDLERAVHDAVESSLARAADAIARAGDQAHRPRSEGG